LYADFEKHSFKLLEVAEKPVIELGALGAFDEHGIFPFSPMWDNGKVVAYTCGWSRRVSVPVETSTGLVFSDKEGKTFERIGDGPVFSSSLNEPFLVGDSFVIKRNGIYHMWYMFGVRWIDNIYEETARVYKIGHATSPDGINWTRDGLGQIIPDKLNRDECAALPTVFEKNGLFHMIFCYREAIGFRNDKSKAYRLGYAYSDDLLHWVRDDENIGIDVSDEGWDSDMMCYPNVFEADGKHYLLYNGNEFGRHGFGVAVLE
jgi:predicted GH43/DUF377 family glycosyl hydrolase